MADIDALREKFRGPVITADDDGYDEARRVYNGMHDRRPKVLVQAVDEADVIAAVRFARESDLELAVRGGGHSVPGYGTCDDGLVLDLGRTKYVRVDPSGRTARVGGGAVLGDLDHACYPFGLATPAGFNSTTGIGGLTLGGGFGAYLSRKYGLTCDNLISADVVTAEGKRVTASADENEDLFWALRGGGGNFGVVTSFEFRVHPLDGLVGGPIFFELDAAPEVMRVFRDYTARAPRELGGFFGFHIAPPLPFIPQDRHGDTLCAIVASWCGALQMAEKMLRPLREAGPVVAEHLGPVPYPALQSAFDPLLPPGLQHYWKSDFLSDLTDEAIQIHMEHGPGVPYVSSTMHLYLLDGAVHDVGRDATAFPVRDARFALNIVGIWPEPKDNDKNVAWVRDYYAAVHPHSGYEGGYTNFMADDDRNRVRENYGSNYDRLKEIKTRWDPDNIFHRNQNIEPGA
jgi:FAD binding domain/Berberine and berberine like